MSVIFRKEHSHLYIHILHYFHVCNSFENINLTVSGGLDKHTIWSPKCAVYLHYQIQRAPSSVTILSFSAEIVEWKKPFEANHRSFFGVMVSRRQQRSVTSNNVMLNALQNLDKKQKYLVAVQISNKWGTRF